jgi:hypothetical protein
LESLQLSVFIASSLKIEAADVNIECDKEKSETNN